MVNIIRPRLSFELATAKILYWLPDHPLLLQEFIWQEYDIPPRFPLLRKFIWFWNRNLEGKVFAVDVAVRTGAGEYRSADIFKHVH